MVDLILKKRNGFSLTGDEIVSMIEGYTHGLIPDYQMSAMLMAIYFNGLSEAETMALTDAMVHSGEVINLSSIPGCKVDKHSTGGVGDKTSLVVGPLVAACGIPVAKMSGRGLGHTGGTLDKLESIPGFRVNLSSDEFVFQVQKIGLAICAQSDKLVPADKKLYALRDVTGTTDQISLIAASIMSKKLASGSDAIVIDLKLGEGAFIKTIEDAEKLAFIMQKIASGAGKKLVAIITNMDQPLGYEIGNFLEVQEAAKTLCGKGPADLTHVCLTLASHMLVAGGRFSLLDTAYEELQNSIKNGKAYDKFIEFVKAQGGDTGYLSQEPFPCSPIQFEYKTNQVGYVSSVLAQEVGKASMYLGAGREKKESSIDNLAGLTLLKKQGDLVKPGDILAILHTADSSLLPMALEQLDKAFSFSKEAPSAEPVILKTILSS